VNEFELIRRFFARQPVTRDDVALGIGDDAAVLDVAPDSQLVVTTDLSIAGVHFLPDADPVSVGHKSLAVSLSDLAAMGADPAWFTLNLSLPEIDEEWLQRFCEGLFGLARRYQIQLIGGDTSRGALAITVAAYGLVPRGQVLRRSGAKIGDRIYVSGALGDPALALSHHRGTIRLPDADLIIIADRLARPMPRVRAGIALRPLANSCIDISDGLLADLGHIAEASHVGARIRLDRIPLSPVFQRHLNEAGWDTALAGGDDYELCFTVPEPNVTAVERLQSQFREGFACIGEIVAGSGVNVLKESGDPYRTAALGHDHFSTAKA
jgi:thiamine-monophosphate kinase